MTVSTTHAPATDLGYLLHKHPGRVQEFAQSFGTATVFYPEATDERCTAALLLDVDALRLARSRKRDSPDYALAQYVNDRPYAASSLLGTAMAHVFGTARAGHCTARPELAATAIPLEITIPVLPCRGGAGVAHRVFGPLGWEVDAEPIPLDDAFPGWGDSRYVSLRLTGTARLADALSQLYVLLPVLDEAKHYWQGSDEVDKLLRSGQGWLADHPDKDLIVRRYLGRRTGLARVALTRLEELGEECPGEDDAEPDGKPVPLKARRHEAVLAALSGLGARTVIDLGCGPGQFLDRLVQYRLGRAPAFTKVAGCDVSARSLHQAARRLRLDRMSERQAARVELFQGALTYEDPRMAGFDAAVLMEVIEHVDPPRLGALERVVFGAARPGAVIVTTPNREYNPLYEGLDGPRHPDHRFEWDRAQFAEWASRAGGAHGYAVTISGIGAEDETRGTPTQMAVFTREEPDRG